MNPFFEYLIKSSFSLALFYIVFKLAVSRHKMYSVNRFVLLGILVGSAFLPFANLPIIQNVEVIPQVEAFREFVAQPVYYAPTVSENIEPIQQTKSIRINWYLIFYLSIISILFIRLLISVKHVLQIVNRAEKQPFQKIIIAVVKDYIQPFSFMKNIVISEKDYTENREIVVAHEYAHIKHLHAIDLLICELFTVLHWFNPFMWFLRRDLKLIHEFQADQAVLNKGIDVQKYQLMVLEKAVGERRFAMANHFTQKPILKRLKMMQIKNDNRWKGLKLVLFIPIILLLLQAFEQPEIITKLSKNDKTEKWLGRWSVENIGTGFYQPAMKAEKLPKSANNILTIWMNRKNEYLIENQFKKKEDVKQIVRNYLLGINPDGKKGPDYLEKEIPFIGKMKVSNGLISFKHDLESSKEMIDYSLRAIGEAFLEVKKEKAQILFGEEYFDLDVGMKEAVDKAAPVRVSYEYPAPPSSSFNLPFNSGTLPQPQPIEITFRNNGEIIVGKYKCDSFDVFMENIEEWSNKLVMINQKSRVKHFYRANLIFEDVPSIEIEKISFALFKRSVHVEQISFRTKKHSKANLEIAKLKAKVEKTKAEINNVNDSI